LKRLAVLLALLSSGAMAQDGLPEGKGREETLAACIACHSTAVIQRSRLSREQWDGLLDWMVERQGMPPLEEDQRSLILDYLSRHFGPGGQGPRGRNPFL
jgi:hypothetical protein